MRSIKIPIVLFLGTVITRVPFRSETLHHWDSVGFALATERYDIALHRPHPPGYFLYVMAGKFLNVFTGDPNASFIAMSVIFSGLAVSAIYMLAFEMFASDASEIFGGGPNPDGKTIALWTAIFALTSPLFWFYGEVASTYIVEAFFATLAALLCYRILRGEHGLLWVAAPVLALAGGIRQSTMAFMLPLVVYSTKDVPAGKRLAALALLAACTMAWFLPMVEMTGGYARYRAAVDEQFRFVIAPYAGFMQPEHIPLSAAAVFRFTIYGAGLGVAFMLFCLVKGRLRLSKKAVFLLLWIAPPVLFYLSVIISLGTPGHGLIFMPAVLIASAWALKALSERLFKSSSRLAFAALAALTAVFNLYMFLFLETPVSRKTLSNSSVYLRAFEEEVRRTLPPDETVILSYDFLYDGPMQFIYYMPEYRTYSIDGSADRKGVRRKVFWGKGREKFISEDVVIPQGVRYFVSPHPDVLKPKLKGIEDKIGILSSGGREIALYGDIKCATLIYEGAEFRFDSGPKEYACTNR